MPYYRLTHLVARDVLFILVFAFLCFQAVKLVFCVFCCLATILRKVLPDNLTPPSAFAVTGHIAHFNLRDEFLPHKYTIGQIILDVRFLFILIGFIKSSHRFLQVLYFIVSRVGLEVSIPTSPVFCSHLLFL